MSQITRALTDVFGKAIAIAFHPTLSVTRRELRCQIGEGAEQKCGRRWFDPTPKPLWERVKAEADALLD